MASSQGSFGAISAAMDSEYAGPTPLTMTNSDDSPLPPTAFAAPAGVFAFASINQMENRNVNTYMNGIYMRQDDDEEVEREREWF